MPSDPKKSNLGLLMENFVITQTRQNDEFKNQNILTNEALEQLTTKIDNVSTHNKMLKTQIFQVSQQQASTFVPLWSFPSQPEQNPKGHLNVLTTWSGKQVVSFNEIVKDVENSELIPPEKKVVE